MVVITHLAMKTSHAAHPLSLLKGMDFDAELEDQSFEPLVNILQHFTVQVKCLNDPLVRLPEPEPGNVGSNLP